MDKRSNTMIDPKNHSGYITSLECKGEFRVIRICPFKLKLNQIKQLKSRFEHRYNIPGVLLTKLTNANNKEIHRLQVLIN